ncbi:acyltransferase [Streptomyces sp. NPDC089799]|uniref:acyltransferase family protein n=1 Tax=Streptomyces sp. NPDC089799 TaxID=3155066 RepID=UPI003437C62D
MSTATQSRPAAQEAAPGARPPAGSPGAGPRPRLYVLDGLRLIAALSVLSFHWLGVNKHPTVWGQKPSVMMPTAHHLASYGWLGVQLFFVISGFVICMSCWGRSPRQYFTSRVVRLYPAYWVCILITALVVTYASTVRADRSKLTPSDVLTNLTMLQWPLKGEAVDGVYWTLFIELRFYLLFAVVVAMGLTYRRVLAFCGIWTILAALTPISGSSVMDLFLMPEYAPYFVAGVAMYLVYRFGANWMLFGVIGFSWLYAQNRLRITVKSYEGEVVHSLSWPVLAVVSALIFLVMTAVAMGAFNWVRWKWLTVAGALTYPVYLLHQELGWAMIRWGRDHGVAPYPLLGICLAAILLLAYLVHRLVERPVSALLRRMLDSATLSLPKADPPVRRP